MKKLDKLNFKMYQNSQDSKNTYKGIYNLFTKVLTSITKFKFTILWDNYIC